MKFCSSFAEAFRNCHAPCWPPPNPRDTPPRSSALALQERSSFSGSCGSGHTSSDGSVSLNRRRSGRSRSQCGFTCSRQVLLVDLVGRRQFPSSGVSNSACERSSGPDRLDAMHGMVVEEARAARLALEMSMLYMSGVASPEYDRQVDEAIVPFLGVCGTPNQKKIHSGLRPPQRLSHRMRHVFIQEKPGAAQAGFPPPATKRFRRCVAISRRRATTPGRLFSCAALASAPKTRQRAK